MIKNMYEFVKESNLIEGITRPPTDEELDTFAMFVELPVVTLVDLQNFVNVYQPNARLRNYYGADVRVGKHIPPSGGPSIVEDLTELLDTILDETPYDAHVAYETLHPFTDCNGRSGRALWAWHMSSTFGPPTLGFLHHFYYQSLDAGRKI